MKKRIISGLLTLCMIISMFAVVLPACEVKVSAATVSQQHIVDRANYMYNATWVCQKTVTGWGGTFYAGSTYHVPYGQPIYSGSYVGFKNNAIDDSSIDTYLAAAADANSIFYSGRSYYTGKEAPYYSNDCSAFVSWCWGVSRKTTASIPNVSTNLGMATASNNYNLQLGDALNSNSAGHVVLVTGLSYNGAGAITSIEITEQTPPQLKKSYYTPESLGAKYGGRYSIQRYYGDVPAAPNSRPIGTSPVGSFDEATGSIGAVTIRGWAVDPDDTGKALDYFVSIGGPVFTPGAETLVIGSEAYREDVNNSFGCGGNHGFHRTIGTKLTGQQEVYVYAYDNDGNAENVLLGNKTVYITPDTEPPVVGEVKIWSSDENKYTVCCDVSDNGYLSRVSFPTWTEADPDNKIWYDGFVLNGVAFCDIPIADFNNYNGKYHTHVYAYDSAGNQAANGNFSTTFNNPVGCLDGISESDGVIRVSGWAFDRDAIDEATAVHVYVGEPGSEYYEGHNITADLERTDVDTANNCGPNHGFDALLTTTMSGTQPVYVYAINKGNGGNILLAKQEITISSEGVPPSITNPRITATTLEGFTVSCDVADNRRVKEVHMAVWPENNHDAMKWYTASVENNVASATVAVADFNNYNGKYIVHIYAYDYNGNSIGYPYETTFNTPVGSLDVVTESDGVIHVRGWALDRDAIDEPVEIHVYVGNPSWIHQGFSGIVADTVRDDVAAALNCDPNHGFDADIKTWMPGTQEVFVYAINKGNGGNVLLGSQIVNISDDTVDPTVNSASISATDKDSFTVSCEVSDDRGIKEVNMAVWPDDNQDVNKWYSATVENGVASARIPIADFDNHSGKYTVHIYAKDFYDNQGGYAYETTFNMPDGCLDDVQGKPGAVYVRGWGLDKDAIDEAVFVDIYIGAPAGEEGAEFYRISADSVREDVDAAFGCGANHGFDTTLETSKRGEQPVYVYVINKGNGDNIYLGTKTVTIDEPPVVEKELVGDIDRNGVVDVMDATTVQRILAGIIEQKEADMIADVDANGQLDVFDATMIQRYLAQYIDKFPADKE